MTSIACQRPRIDVIQNQIGQIACFVFQNVEIQNISSHLNNSSHRTVSFVNLFFATDQFAPFCSNVDPDFHPIALVIQG